MKNQITVRSASNLSALSGQRGAGVRLHTAKTFEHRHARRKVREQLRRLDWAPSAEDEIFA